MMNRMFFSELYSAYYNTVAAVLAKASSRPVSREELRDIIEQHAFGESIEAISKAFAEERWQLLNSDGKAVVKHPPTMPLTLLQKSWLKAIALDPRIRLFGDISFDFPEVEPMFLPSDVIVFDKYSDGDVYEDEEYIANFRLILKALENHHLLEIEALNRRGKPVRETVYPKYLEYSEKDDKFRLIGTGGRFGSTINLGRIISCKMQEGTCKDVTGSGSNARVRSVVFELTDQRNALERVLLHFAHFEKTAERIEGDKYRITIKYDKADETELLIRILSFGQMIKVIQPQYFVNLIRERLINQKNCGIE